MIQENLPISFQPKANIPAKVYLNQIDDSYLPSKQKKTPVLVCGTCVKILRANDKMTIF